jgi:hypothetical protein
MLSFIFEHQVVILGFLLGFSELLALLPNVKANSIFQLFVNLIKSLKPKSPEQP